MMIRKLVLSVCGAVTVVLLGVTSVATWGSEANRTSYLTFNVPVGIPGVGLASGTYIFELADPEVDPSIVRVSSRDRSTVYLMAFTELIRRPDGMRRDSPVSFGEAAPDSPVPIAAWYPAGESTGRRFIYRKSERRLVESIGR